MDTPIHPENLESQVAREKAEIDAAPTVDTLPPIGRCSFCGRVATRVVLVESVPIERWKCEVCFGEGF